jgi:hypothetical protein
MPIRNSTPVSFFPTGTSDAFDQSSAFNGACQLLQNLIFDRDNRGAAIARPGVVPVQSFVPLFTVPGPISCMFQSGDIIYGMVASQRFPGYDEPFVWNEATQTFYVVQGVTAANVPVTQPTTGAWVPPTMDALGIYVIVTHPGFSSPNFFGWFNLTTPTVPTWSAGNTGTNALPTPPQWVAQFFGRAYFGVGNAVYFTDSLALTISNTNFAGVLTIADLAPSTGAAGLPLSQTSGAVLQALCVFKQDSIWCITGDITENTLSLNRLSQNIGCVAPLTIEATPIGIIFIATDGPRIINFSGQVLYLQNFDTPTPDLVSAFNAAITPSRMSAAFANGIYRVGFDGPAQIWDTQVTFQEYWYDLIFQRWNGPHTFQYHQICAAGNNFYLANNNIYGQIFSSAVVPTGETVYQDFGNNYFCQLVSTCMAGAPMTMSAVVESTIELGGAGLGVSYYISMYDDKNNALSPATISLYAVDPIWGVNRWAQFQWRSSITNSQVFSIPWVNPVVFKKMVLSVLVLAAENVSVKETQLRVQTLGYTNA